MATRGCGQASGKIVRGLIYSLLNKPMLQGKGHRLQPAVDVELVEDILDMVPRSRRTDGQGLGDVAGAESLRQEG